MDNERLPLSHEQIYSVCVAMLGLQIHIQRIYEHLETAHPECSYQDIRLGMFVDVHQNLGNTRITLNLYNEHILSVYANAQIKEANAFGNTGGSKYKILFDYESYAARAYFEPLFHQAENALRSILRHIAPGACDDGRDAFHSVYTSLLKTQLSQNPAKAIELLDLFRLVRNTLHNDGLYREDDRTVTYKGKSYPFIRDTRIGLTWPLLIVLTKDLIDLFRVIVEDPRVTAHIAPIPSPAWDVVQTAATESRNRGVSALGHDANDLQVFSQLYQLGATETSPVKGT